jgi:hypothetical protein
VTPDKMQAMSEQIKKGLAASAKWTAGALSPEAFAQFNINNQSAGANSNSSTSSSSTSSSNASTAANSASTSSTAAPVDKPVNEKMQK